MDGVWLYLIPARLLRQPEVVREVSYTSADQAWAEWIAWELEAAGYTTLIQAWDFRPGTDWAIKMQEGTTE
jgi:hypothetical protein